MLMIDLEVLKATRERLFLTGWMKGRVGGGGGPNCLWGAVYYAANGDHGQVRPIEYLLGNICGTHNVALFNDAEGTTFGDVIDLIDQAIKVVEVEQK